jgi:hypothetical protein
VLREIDGTFVRPRNAKVKVSTPVSGSGRSGRAWMPIFIRCTMNEMHERLSRIEELLVALVRQRTVKD